MRRRLILIIGAAALLLSSACVAMPRLMRGTLQAPVQGRAAALRAHDDAQAEEASRWAPEAFAVSQHQLDAALAEYDRQLQRFPLLRNYTLARSLLDGAASRSHAALDQARLNRLASAQSLRQRFERAAEMVAIGRAFASLVPLTSDERARLGRSRLLFVEATHRRRDGGDVATSMRLATDAESLSSDVSARCAARASRYADPNLVKQWRAWVESTIDWSRQSRHAAIVVCKATHSLTLYRNGAAVATYRAELGSNNVADKFFSGDLATPEGRYKIVAKKNAGKSKYYKALALDYPSAEDLERHRKAARASRAKLRGPGGDIEIHGEGGRGRDWTRGCVALTNSEMDELFEAVVVDTPVTIVGSLGDEGAFGALVQRYQDAARGRQG